MVKRPILYMLVGIPASGKSTYSTEFLSLDANDRQLLSADLFIEAVARAREQTYDEVWNDETYKLAEKALHNNLVYALDRGLDVVWDQTNLTKKSRAKKLAKFPAYYEKVAIDVSCDWDVNYARLNSRPGKTIPMGVVRSMVASYQAPTLDEGFDRVYRVTT